VLTSEHDVTAAQGARWRALSELLPNVDGRVAEARQTINLAAFGLTVPASRVSSGPSTPSMRVSPCEHAPIIRVPPSACTRSKRLASGAW
jgi:hypothetical protein